MATNDVYLRPDAGDGTNGVRLRPDGPDSGGAVNYELVCAAGSYVYTGQAATLSVGRNLALAAGAYTYTGQSAGLVVGRRLSLAAGAYTYTGQSAGLVVGRNLALSAGAYTYTGQDATLTYTPGAGQQNYVLLLDSGAYVYTGQNAALEYVSPSTQTYGATNYQRGQQRRIKRENDEPNFNRVIARALEQELRIKAEKRKAENELRDAENAATQQTVSRGTKPQDKVSRNAAKSSSSAAVAYRQSLRDRIQQYDAELSALRTEEIGLRLRAIHAEQQAQQMQDEQDVQDILTILMLDEI